MSRFISKLISQQEWEGTIGYFHPRALAPQHINTHGFTGPASIRLFWHLTSLPQPTMEPLGTTTIFLLVCIACLLFVIRRSRSQKGEEPPGPTAYPIVGNLLQINPRNLPESLKEVRDCLILSYVVFIAYKTKSSPAGLSLIHKLNLHWPDVRFKQKQKVSQIYMLMKSRYCNNLYF